MSINHEDYTIEELLAPVNNGLTTGGNMNSANFAFTLLCEKLGIDREELVYRPGWSHKGYTYLLLNYTVPLKPGECRKIGQHGILYRCVMCGDHVIDELGIYKTIPDHNCQQNLETKINVQTQY